MKNTILEKTKINSPPHLQTETDIVDTSSPQNIVAVGADTQRGGEMRHTEVYHHMAERLADVLRRLEALAGEIAYESAKEATPESNTSMPTISLHDFIQTAAGEMVENFTNEATNQIARIREMLF